MDKKTLDKAVAISNEIAVLKKEKSCINRLDVTHPVTEWLGQLQFETESIRQDFRNTILIQLNAVIDAEIETREKEFSNL